ncbi:branched-chain amino acid transport system ATP-binding protein [Roseovarius azorensis]|uniref:Branched-chain amino acid transport system ATP-binding protein n=1 Tax=Roseovarius azorensis TaxID=1287727 RepID=A0A1H7U2A4_9RHOB|nr:branched-chain amino acid transport system ATP-binding protein [Roseovarius azorensis]
MTRGIHGTQQGITTIIAQQNVVRALVLPVRAVVLDMGWIVFDGIAAGVRENEELRAEYLAIRGAAPTVPQRRP